VIVAISMRYFVTIECDTCTKKVQFESLQLGADRVPLEWIQATPPGEVMQREFCSVECVGNWTPPPKPWQDEEVPA
jgi:hypothetical protein